MYDSLEAFVKERGGNRALRRILVANNGIAAVKCIRSIRRWAYETFGNEREIHFTVMTTPEDLGANAEYIRMADEFVEVPGGANNNNFANVRLIVQVAESVNADAVWAGWGHASENPALPEALAASPKNIVFIGPRPRAMRDLGDKIGSSLLAQSANVPTLPWNGDGITVDYAADGLSDDAIRQASVKSVEEARVAAQHVGFPLMIKASEGGGGKGIRMCASETELEALYLAVCGEVPGSPIFLMQLATEARHLEVQLLADTYGHAIALSGRDCSVQRRHQKIMEEGPVTAASPEVWARMERAAVRLAELVQYANAGTVEYLYLQNAPAGSEPFAFLELNPRLQVEHPVTEMITGVNLPAAQLQVAMGLRLDRLPDVRELYGVDRHGTSAIDFGTATQRPPKGHVIAARITAENPDSGFQPTSGEVTELNFRSTPDVWGYFSVDSSGRVHEFADSQIGHLFAWGESRPEARRRLVLALKELSIRGDIHTTVHYLVGLAESKDYRNNNFSTAWLDRRIAENVMAHKPQPLRVAVLGAVVMAHQTFVARKAGMQSALARGQTPGSELASVHSSVDLTYSNARYSFKVAQAAESRLVIQPAHAVEQVDSAVCVQLRELSDGGLLVALGSKSHVVYFRKEGSGQRLMIDGATCMLEPEYDPSTLTAAVSGKVARLVAQEGQHCASGETWAELEVMKMYLPLRVPEPGTLQLLVAEGTAVSPGDVLARVALDDPSKVKRAEVWRGHLPADWRSAALAPDDASSRGTASTSAAASPSASPTAGDASFAGQRPALAAAEALQPASKLTPLAAVRRAQAALVAALDGFQVPEPEVAEALQIVDEAALSPAVAVEELEEALAQAASKLPPKFVQSVSAALSADDAAAVPGQVVAEVRALQASGTDSSWSALRDVVQPLHATALRYAGGMASARRAMLRTLLQMFLDVEARWGSTSAAASGAASGAPAPRHAGQLQDEDVVAQLRPANGATPEQISDAALQISSLLRAHGALRARVRLVLPLLHRVGNEIERLKCHAALADVRALADGAAAGNADAAEAMMASELASEESLLHELANLAGTVYSEVALEARQLLIRMRQPSVLQRMVALEQVLRGTPSTPHSALQHPAFAALVQSEPPLLDVLMQYFAHSDASLKQLAAELYVRRLYRAYTVQHVSSVSCSAPDVLQLNWRFEQARPRASSEPVGLAPADSFDNLLSLAQEHSPPARGQASKAGSRPASSVSGDSQSGDGAAPGSGADSGRWWSPPAAQPAGSPSGAHAAERRGCLVVAPTLDAWAAAAPDILAKLVANAEADSSMAPSARPHVLHVVLLSAPLLDGQRNVPGDAQAATLRAPLSPFAAQLDAARLRRVTLYVPGEADGLAVDAAQLMQAALNLARAGMSANRAPALSLPARLLSTAYPNVYTFRARTKWNEDTIVRHIEPPLSGYLDLPRLANFRIRLVATPNRTVHVYEALPKSGRTLRGAPRKRFFVRAIVRQTARVATLRSEFAQFPGPERAFVDALNALDVAMGDALVDTATPVGNNHIFLNLLPATSVPPAFVEEAIKVVAKRYASRLRRLRVATVEFKFCSCSAGSSQGLPLRLVSHNPTGYVLRVDTYAETVLTPGGPAVFSAISSSHAANDAESASSSERGARLDTPNATGSAIPLLPPLPGSSMDAALRRLGAGEQSQPPVLPRPAGPSSRGEWDGKPVTTPYPVTSMFDARRALAAAMSDTLYVYDFLELFERALETLWTRECDERSSVGLHQRPATVMKATELVLMPSDDSVAARAPHSTHAPASTSASPAHARMRASASALFSNEMGTPDAFARDGAHASTGLPSATTNPNDDDDAYGAHPIGTRVCTGGLIGSQDGSKADQAEWVLREVQRPQGKNDIGMVAWELTMFTPEHPEAAGGRKVIVIANDITHRAGSFGTMEDRLFKLASERARAMGVPRIYIAANSGARIGLAEEVKSAFKVAWCDPVDPSKGFDYLYLDDEAHSRLASAGSVRATLKMGPAGERRWVLHDVIGVDPDLGVENLRGSGTIAGETARAYAQNCTLTYVTGRTVGIGAYLVRLGQRVIQKAGAAPILLTGYQALNKLIGASVYSSNDQLGGPRVMFSNGVSHEVVPNDMAGVHSILSWLQYLPACTGEPLPVARLPAGESLARDIGFTPQRGQPYDPRHFMAGARLAPGANGSSSSEAAWMSGFFDRGSWQEVLAGWARTVVVGRARLGGIPCGAIMTETRTVSTVIPADPAAPDSQENVVVQAGQVWFPDSAYKTAQAIRDFNGEGLPLFIFSNWRGFSGGQRDMFDQVLKYGAYIVDALVGYTSPVFVYIPPYGELRGGAWVVVDPAINSEVMEMYAAPTARGGVLEPSGIVSIKFRAKDLRKTMLRLDSRMQELAASESDALGRGDADAAREAAAAGDQRAATLSPIYVSAAQALADLHDTPGRMLEKGVIRGIVAWRKARVFFYWRLRRTLAEFALARRLQRADSSLKFLEARDTLRQWFEASAAEAVPGWVDDVAVLKWMSANKDAIEAQALAAQRASIASTVVSLGVQDASAVVSGVLALLNQLPSDQREPAVTALRRHILMPRPHASSGDGAWLGVTEPSSPQFDDTGMPQRAGDTLPALNGPQQGTAFSFGNTGGVGGGGGSVASLENSVDKLMF